MSEELNFEKYRGERVQVTLNKELAERLQLVRDYCETIESISPSSKKDILQAIDDGTLVDMAVESFIDGMFHIDIDDNQPQ